MRIVFMGTNGWFDSDTGNTISILIDAGDFALVLDAGNGIAKLDRYIGLRDIPVYLFLSHFHLDHICGLHTIDKNLFPRGLHILGQAGTAAALNAIITQPYTKPFAEMSFDVSVHEYPFPDLALPFGITMLPMTHSSPCVGARIEYDGRVIAYVPDTGYNEHEVALARNADVLIAECAHLPGEENPSWPHLNPETGARIAREAAVKRLVLAHFDAHRYGCFAKRDAAQAAARTLFGNSDAAVDGMEITLC